MKLTVEKRVGKQLSKLPKLKQLVIAAKIRSLINGEVANTTALAGHKNAFRVRVGDYRIIYLQLKDEIVVLMVGHRREVYELFERLLK